MSQISNLAPTADLSRSAVARYIQLATLFRRRIESGHWKIGSQIPTVDDLVVQCGVARATIRQALGILEAEGLVARYRAKGTFVTRRPQELLSCEIETDWTSLLSERKGAVIAVVSNKVVDQPALLPHAIGVPSKSYRWLKRRHTINGVPFLIADVYIDAALADRLPSRAFTTKTALRLAASLPGVKIMDARQTLTIGTADVETAAYLDIPLNSPIGNMSRSAVDQKGRLVLVTNGIYRGDFMRLEMKLR